MYLHEIKSIISEKTGYIPRSSGSGFLGRCPAHDDRTPSLSLAQGKEGCILLKCHAGCTIDQLCASLQIDKKDLFNSDEENKEYTQTTVYTYHSRDGKPLYKKTRIEPGKEGRSKDFYVSTIADDGNWIKGLGCNQRVLYQLPEVVKAIEEGKWIFLVEGEKNAEDLRLYGLVATTAVEGAGSKWKEEYIGQLEGSKVALLYDEDSAGHKRRDEIIHALSGRIEKLKVISLPGLEFRESHGLDISDWLNQGNTIDTLLALVESTEAPILPHSSCKMINLEDFLALKLPQRELILQPFLPKQGLCLLYAKRGVGKTHVALNIAYAVATGGSFLKWTASKPFKVLYIDGEMPAKSMQDRLRMIALKGDKPLPAPDYLQLITPDLQDLPLPDLSTIEGQEIIDGLSSGADLIIIDNLSTLARKGIENEAESWLPIQSWALKKRREGKSILFVHHANKNGGQRGTSRKEDILDAVINLKQPTDHTPDEGARFQVVFEKTRHFANEEADSFEVFLHTEDGVWQWGIAESEQDELTPKIVALHEEGKSIREIAKILEITKGKVETRLKKQKAVCCPVVQNPIENRHQTLKQENQDGQ